MARSGWTSTRRTVAALVLAVLSVASAVGVRADQASPERVTVDLRAGTGSLSGGRSWDASGVTGTATLAADGDQTVVALVVRGAAGTHPDHIHRGRCADPEPNPLYPLSDVVLNPADREGRSTTRVDVSLRELLAGEYLILVHESAQNLNVYLACGDIVARREAAMPNTGVAPRGGVDDRPLLAGLGAAALLAVAALAARRRAAERS
jgi:hypothetical protein